MKNYLVFLGFIFSIFIIPSDVFASSLYLPYTNEIEDFDVLNGEGEILKNSLYAKIPSEDKNDNGKCFLGKTKDSIYIYDLVCSNTDIVSNISFRFNGYYSSLVFSSDEYLFTTYSFDSEFNYLSSFSRFVSSHFPFSNPGYYNYILYSDFLISFSNINPSYSSIVFYDVSNPDYIYGELDSDSFYSYKDFYLTDYKGSSSNIPVFQDNDLHSLSKIILGDNIPEEYSFVYTISDYLFVLIIVGIIISPIAIIIKILRW